jgi:hypothetical protein
MLVGRINFLAKTLVLRRLRTSGTLSNKFPPEDTGSPKTPNQWHAFEQVSSRRHWFSEDSEPVAHFRTSFLPKTLVLRRLRTSGTLSNKFPPEDTGSPKTPNQWHTFRGASSRTIIQENHSVIVSAVCDGAGCASSLS